MRKNNQLNTSANETDKDWLHFKDEPRLQVKQIMHD